MDKVFEKRLIFKCDKCGTERFGSDEKVCEHDYGDYKIKKPNED